MDRYPNQNLFNNEIKKHVYFDFFAFKSKHKLMLKAIQKEYERTYLYLWPEMNGGKASQKGL